MAPRKDEDTAAAEALKILCILMATAAEFTPDYDAAAAQIGIAQARNVTRKVNSIIEPVGYTMSKKKVVKIGDDAANPTPPTLPIIHKDAVTKAKTPAKSAKSASTRRPLAKKVNVKEQLSEEDDETEDESDEKETDGGDEEDEESPATKAIKDAMTGSDVSA